VNGRLPIRPAGTQYDRGELRLVDRVGKMLSFEAEAAVLGVVKSAMSEQRSIKEIAGAELQSLSMNPHVNFI
jgi:hypothetical protein